jgi:hypothetical protein
MKSALGSLHKILKDETREKIVLLLKEKGNQSYMDLMKSLKIKSTGKMNYHLKILNDLITKTPKGEYILTEKGKLAARLLDEFTEENSQELGLKPKWWRPFWIGQSVGIVSVLLYNLGLVFYGSTDLNSLYYPCIYILIGDVSFYYLYLHVIKGTFTFHQLSKLFYITIGALGLGVVFWVALIEIFYVSGIYSFISSGLPKNLFGDLAYFGGFFLVSCVIGGFIGNFAGKKRGYYVK